MHSSLSPRWPVAGTNGCGRTWSCLFLVGDRIHLGDMIGDVVDIGMLLTERTVTGAHAAVFRDQVSQYTRASASVWDECTAPVCYGLKWPQAQHVAREAVAEHTADGEPQARRDMRALPGITLVGLPETHPPVLVFQALVRALVREGIEVASPALTGVRYPAERTWEEDGLCMMGHREEA